MKTHTRESVCFDCRLQEPHLLGDGRIAFRCVKKGRRHIVPDSRIRQPACGDFEPLVTG